MQDAGDLGDGIRRQRMITGDHRDPDAGVLALGPRPGDLWARWILEAEQPLHRQIAFILIAARS
jgi:hypothetical protein